MNYSSLDALCTKLNVINKANEIMARHTSFKIGGIADRFVQINTKEQALEILNLIEKENLPYFVIGNGSNILISDKGIKAVVISLAGDFKKIELIDENTIKCGSGTTLASLCVFAKNNDLSGLEFAYGIPATVGGAVYMNAGAYGGEIKDVLSKVECVKDAEVCTFLNSELEFSYRHSYFSNKKYLITEAYFNLQKSNQEKISQTMEEIMFKRKDKQPLEFPSAGSTFKRPMGYFAAALIEECGLKGLSVGDAQVSVKHSGFIINKGNATAENVLELVEKVKNIVKKEKNVELECEIKLIGG